MIAAEQTVTETIARPIRVLGLLNGDIADRAGDARIKYGLLFAALARHCDLVAVRDVELRGLDRCQNALRTMRWPRERWRAAFRTNNWSFQRRTDRARTIARAYQNEVDIL